MIGMSFSLRANYDSALFYLRAATRASPDSLPDVRAKIFGDLAQVYGSLGRADSAGSLIRQSFEEYRRGGMSRRDADLARLYLEGTLLASSGNADSRCHAASRGGIDRSRRQVSRQLQGQARRGIRGLSGAAGFGDRRLATLACRRQRRRRTGRESRHPAEHGPRVRAVGAP